MLNSCASEPTRFGSSTRNIGADEAIAMPPPGDLAIVEVIEKRYDNALQQEIFLSTASAVPGQNVMSVQFFGTKSPMKFSNDQLAYNPLTEARVNSEMRGTLPGVRMVRSPLIVQNDYGAFGYAFGRPGGAELCMYAWQQIRSPSGTVSPLQNYGAIQIRVRLCETGVSEEKLLSFMYGFSITGSLDDPGWNPYGTPAPVSSRLGRSGAPIYPPATGTLPLPSSGVSSLPSVAVDAARPKPVLRRKVADERMDGGGDSGANYSTGRNAAPVQQPAVPALAEQYPGIVVPSPTGAQTPRPAMRQPASPVPQPGRSQRVITPDQPSYQQPVRRPDQGNGQTSGQQSGEVIRQPAVPAPRQQQATLPPPVLETPVMANPVVPAPGSAANGTGGGRISATVAAPASVPAPFVPSPTATPTASRVPATVARSGVPSSRCAAYADAALPERCK